MLAQRRNLLIAVVIAVSIVVAFVVVTRRSSSDSAASARAAAAAGSPGAGSTSATDAAGSVVPGAGDPGVSGDPGANPAPSSTDPPPAPGPGNAAPPPTEDGLPEPIPVQVSTSATSNLADGQAVTVKVTANAGSLIYSAIARLCAPGAKIKGLTQFLPSFGQCSAKPMSALGDGIVTQPSEEPHQQLELTFKVGAGTQTWKTDQGKQYSLTCGPGKPCQLVLQLELPNDTRFFAVPVTFR